MISRVLSIAGSDSSGGAGIQTDLKTFSALGVYGMSAITSITAQNTLGVSMIQDVSPDCVQKQIEACLDDIGADAIKVGMLSNAEIIKAVEASFIKYSPRNVVIDPVMVATTGFYLLKEDAISALKDLLKYAFVITPNKAEAEALSGIEIDGDESAIVVAKELARFTSGAVLIKSVAKGRDLLYADKKAEFIGVDWIETTNSHGTGCTLSSAIASYLALGFSRTEAIKKGKSFITMAIEHALPIGNGSGPTNPLWKTWQNI